VLKNAGQDLSDLGIGLAVHRVRLHARAGLSLLITDLAHKAIELIDGQAGPSL
jgi:hypothetical protein